jgi:hypothetical protein
MFGATHTAPVLPAPDQWKAPADLVSESELQRSLAGHLGSQGFAVRAEAWVGRRNRVDLVVDEAIAVERVGVPDEVELYVER